MKTCHIFCAGGFEKLAEPIQKGDPVLAADGGLIHLEKLGIRPDGVIGDFDSLGYVPQGAQVFPVEKDDTDSLLALRKGMELGCRRFVIYGALDGPRLDHTVANLQALCFLCEHGAEGYLVGLSTVATAVKEQTLTFPETAEGILSVFCMGVDCRVSLKGVQYEMENGTLTSHFPLGVSNHFVGKAARITVHEGCALVLWDGNNGFPQRA